MKYAEDMQMNDNEQDLKYSINAKMMEINVLDFCFAIAGRYQAYTHYRRQHGQMEGSQKNSNNSEGSL